MKKWLVIAIALGILGVSGWYYLARQTPRAYDPTASPILKTGSMELRSTAFSDNQNMPPQYTCDGADISPPLTISDVPEEAQSLVLIMDDPDVPAISGVAVWDHWIVFNIPPTTTEIPEGTEPPGVHGIGTSKNLNYHGPCPPDREHRYILTLSALDTQLALPEGATKQQVQEAMKGHVIEQTQLTGRYNRQ